MVSARDVLDNARPHLPNGVPMTSPQTPDLAGADPLEVADLIDRLLAAIPADDADPVDRPTRSRLEGYAAGLRAGAGGIPSP